MKPGKILLFTLTALVLWGACKKDRQDSTAPGRFEIVVSKSSVDGNLVMGLATTVTNTFTLSSKNAPAGAQAIISADTVNGVYIQPTTVALKGDTVKVPVSGKPVADGVFLLTIKVAIGETVYICTKEFYVDLPNITAITSSLPADTTVYNVVDSSKLNFQVNPHTAAYTITVPAHITAQLLTVTGGGKELTLYADDQFLEGDVVLTSTYLNVTPLVNTIHLRTFSGGDGTTADPYQVADTARLGKIRLAPSKAFRLVADIAAPKPTLAGVTFTGTLDGNGKKITGYTLASTTANTGFFAAIGAGGLVKDLSFSNISVTGKDYTGGLAAVNNGTITNVTIAGTITGNNYVGGITGDNFGSLVSCDVTNANVNGLNYIGTLTGNINSGSSQPANLVLSTATNFPTDIYNVNGIVNQNFAFTPGTGTIAVKSVPAGFTSSVAAQAVTLNTPPGFVSGNMQITLQAGKLSSTRNVMLYSKAPGAVFDAGDGSAANPFIISTEAAFDSIVLAPSKYYQLAADISLTKTWVTIPVFSGSLDGKGFQVSGLVINATTANSGLTGTHTGSIKNIRFLNVTCTTTANTFGVIAGTNKGGVVQNVIVSGSITSTATVDTLGGFVGSLVVGGKVTQCYGKLTITAACGMVGGIAGCLTSNANAPEISYSTTAGSIEITAAKTRIGGILGRGAGSVISGGALNNCLSSMDIKATGAASASANSFGGIFGADQSAGIVPIDQCMFIGTVASGFSVGGIAGVGSNITNCLVAGQGSGLGASTLLSTGTPTVGAVGGIAGTNKNGQQYCIVKNATLRGSASASYPVGGIGSTYQNSGFTSKCVVINTSIDGGANSTRVTGTASGSSPAGSTGTHSNNYVGPGITAPNRTTAFVDDMLGVDGQLQATMPFSFFTGLGFSSSVWKLDTDGYPTLANAGYNGGYTTP